MSSIYDIRKHPPASFSSLFSNSLAENLAQPKMNNLPLATCHWGQGIMANETLSLGPNNDIPNGLRPVFWSHFWTHFGGLKKIGPKVHLSWSIWLQLINNPEKPIFEIGV